MQYVNVLRGKLLNKALATSSSVVYGPSTISYTLARVCTVRHNIIRLVNVACMTAYNT